MSTSVSVHTQPTASQPVMSTSVPVLMQPISNQSSLPPVPLHIRGRIICGEFAYELPAQWHKSLLVLMKSTV